LRAFCDTAEDDALGRTTSATAIFAEIRCQIAGSVQALFALRSGIWDLQHDRTHSPPPDIDVIWFDEALPDPVIDMNPFPVSAFDPGCVKTQVSFCPSASRAIK
jgi:hypothetical protein